MKAYWKVHIDNFKYFLDYTSKKYNIVYNNEYDLFKTFYKNNDHLYLCIEPDHSGVSDYMLSYSHYNSLNKEWLDNNNYEYIGNFYSRKDKLEMLNNLSDS